MLLTEAQLQEIRQIIADHHTAFAVNNISPDIVPPSELERLSEQGLIKTQSNSIEDSYLYGQLLAMMEDPNIAKMSFEEFKAHMKKNPIPLTEVERQAIKMAQMKAGQYAVGLGNVVNNVTGEILIEADADLRQRMRDEIKTQTAANIARRETVKQLKSKLGWATNDWARDWDRIAITEKHNVMQRGVADRYAKSHGPDARVAKRPMPDACEHCKRLHIGTDGHPRIFRLSELEGNGTNYKKQTGDWLPVIGATHPHCQCQLIRIPNGWGFNEEGQMVPGGEFGEETENLELSLKQEMDLQKAFKLHGHMTYQGIPIAIENDIGTVRKWTDALGNQGETVMRVAYGYMKRTTGADEDEIDVFLGPDPNAKYAYIIEQQDPFTGRYDEQKVMLGCSNESVARLLYADHFNRPDFYFTITPMEMEAFKRWAGTSEKLSGHMMKKSGPKLVIPLVQDAPNYGIQKAELQTISGSQNTTYTLGSMQVNANRNPGVGTTPNFIFNVPDRGDTGTAEDMSPTAREFLEEGQKDRDVLSRNKDVYTFQEPYNWTPRPVILPDEVSQGLNRISSPETLLDGSTKERRKYPDSIAKRTANDGIKPKYVIEEKGKKRGDVEDSDDELEKAGPYIGPKGGMWADSEHTQHWEPEKHGGPIVKWLTKTFNGRIELDQSDKTRLVLKLKAKYLSKPDRTKLESLFGKPQEKGKILLWPMSDKKLRAAEEAAEAKMKPQKPKAVVKKQDIKPKRKVQYLDPAEMKRPDIPKWVIQRGDKVILKDGTEAVCTGFDSVNNPTIDKNGMNYKMPGFGSMKKAGDEPGKATFDGLPKEAFVIPNKRERQLAQDTRNMKVVGDKTASEAYEWLESHGHEVMMVGGIVRDMVRGVADGDNDADIKEAMQDLDLITSASPMEGLRLAGELKGIDTSKMNPGELMSMAKAHKYSKDLPIVDSSAWGTVTVGELDINSVSVVRAQESKKSFTIGKHTYKSTNSVFDHSLEEDTHGRDFTCNSLFYDVINDVIIDPTGKGYVDAQNKVLRFAGSELQKETSNSLPFRFWKFRARGWKPEEETLKMCSERMEHWLQKMSPDEIAGMLAIQVKHSPPKKAVQALKAFEQAMRDDGVGHLWDKHIASLLDVALYNHKKNWNKMHGGGSK